MTGVGTLNTPTVSGLNDFDYQNLSGLGPHSPSQLKTVGKVPLPPEVMEHFGRILLHETFICLCSSSTSHVRC